MHISIIIHLLALLSLGASYAPRSGPTHADILSTRHTPLSRRHAPARWSSKPLHRRAQPPAPSSQDPKAIIVTKLRALITGYQTALPRLCRRGPNVNCLMTLRDIEVIEAANRRLSDITRENAVLQAEATTVGVSEQTHVLENLKQLAIRSLGASCEQLSQAHTTPELRPRLERAIAWSNYALQCLQRNERAPPMDMAEGSGESSRGGSGGASGSGRAGGSGGASGSGRAGGSGGGGGSGGAGGSGSGSVGS